MDRRKQNRREERRTLTPRQFNRREKTFIYQRRVYLSDTNSFQNVYFAKFYEFIGEAREELLRYLMRESLPELMASGIVLLTRDCSLKFRDSIYLYDDITISVSLTRSTAMRVCLDFTIINNTRDQVAAEGQMTIAEAREGKVCRIPALLSDRLSDLFIKGTTNFGEAA